MHLILVKRVILLGNKFHNLKAKNMKLLSHDFLHRLLRSFKEFNLLAIAETLKFLLETFIE